LVDSNQNNVRSKTFKEILPIIPIKRNLFNINFIKQTCRLLWHKETLLKARNSAGFPSTLPKEAQSQESYLKASQH
jgi:hypothetical protein